MRILMLGDTHGDSAWVRHAIQLALNNKCEQIVQLGDFGYWPHHVDGIRFLDKVSRNVSEADLKFFWVDGNHENHDMIQEMLEQSDRLATYPWKSDEGFIEHKPNVFYMPRGTVWDWDGVKFMGLGGAYSVDAKYRTPGVSWWSREVITDSDVERAIGNGLSHGVDVMLTHDCPEGAAAIDRNGSKDRQKDLWPESVANMKRIRMVCDEVQPKLLFHGHHHRRYDDKIAVGNPARLMTVRGLGRDGDTQGSTYVFDTDQLR